MMIISLRVMMIAFAVTMMYSEGGASNSHISLNIPTDLISNPKWNYFKSYMDTYNKSYSVDELRDRFENFIDNLDMISLQENRYDHYVGLNPFTDLSYNEFRSEIGAGCFVSKALQPTCNTYVPTEDNLHNLPDSVDWRNHSAVTPVKNQKKCGSCWSFSATGAMEGAWALATGKLVSLSEQQLLDCSVDYGDHACNGGIMDDAFSYAIDHGMCSEEEDPYHASKGTCKKCTPVVHITSCYNVQPYNQLHLQAAVARGPVSIAIEADTSIFQFYTGGVLKSDDCGNALDHGVLIVGYGEENGDKYWLVKNSWGPAWGDNGYIKIARSNSTHDAGVCGIAMQPAFPVAESNAEPNAEPNAQPNAQVVRKYICNRWNDVLDT
jgi:C1A family cysteine protease